MYDAITWSFWTRLAGEQGKTCFCKSASHTVDGSEIKRSPVEVCSLSYYLQGLSTMQTVVAFFFAIYEALTVSKLAH